MKSIGEDLHADGAPHLDVVQARHESIQIEPAFSRQQSVVQRGMHEVWLGMRRCITELHSEYAIGRNRTQELVIGRPSEVVPSVKSDAAVRLTCSEDDLPGRVQIRDLRPRQKLKMNEQAMFCGSTAKGGERSGRLLERPVPAKDIYGVDRARTECFCDNEEIRLVEFEDAVLVELGRDSHVLGSRQPRPGRIDLRY